MIRLKVILIGGNQMGRLTVLKQIAADLASQFGPDCEVVIHDLKTSEPEHSIVYIVNGHVTNRDIGDGPSNAVFDAIRNQEKGATPEDHTGYLMKTADGKILKCSTSYIHDDDGTLHYVFGINYDISLMLAMEKELSSFTGTIEEDTTKEPIAVNIGDLLDELISQSVQHIGKPVTLMTKEDKVQVVRLLNEAGAFLITKSGPKVCQFLGISKYTLYSYLDEIKSKNTI